VRVTLDALPERESAGCLQRSRPIDSVDGSESARALSALFAARENCGQLRENGCVQYPWELFSFDVASWFSKRTGKSSLPD
jgi:hypothetical protein